MLRRALSPCSATITTALVLWLTLLPAAEARKAPAPAKRTYFVIFLGGEGGYETSATCLRFSRSRICDIESDICGSWEHREVTSDQTGLWFEIEFTEDEVPVVIEGTARTEDRFRRSSIGGAATISIDGRVGNFSLVGREIKPGPCRAQAAAFNARAATP